MANTTTGSKAFSIQQFVNDTVGLLDVLKIQKADVLGHSMGGMVAQQLAVTHPEKVNRLILVSTTCGGKDSIPPSPQLAKFVTEFENKLLNNIPITPQEIKLTMSASLGPACIRLHPNSLDTIPKAGVPSQDLFPGVPVNTVVQQQKVVLNWRATSWIGICDELSKISNPTLIITGTDDGSIQPANSLIIAGKIPGSWLVQIKDAGHQVMSQYPDKFKSIANISFYHKLSGSDILKIHGCQSYTMRQKGFRTISTTTYQASNCKCMEMATNVKKNI